jgi:antitoxin HicB
MKPFVYAAIFEPGDRKRAVVVSFPDVPEAITQGRDMADAHEQAAEALGLALLTYPERGLPLPKPKAKAKGKQYRMVAVPAEDAAKLALIDAFARARITRTEFAKRIDRDEREARRLLDPKHPSKLSSLSAALAVFGKRLVVGVEEIDAAA